MNEFASTTATGTEFKLHQNESGETLLTVPSLSIEKVATTMDKVNDTLCLATREEFLMQGKKQRVLIALTDEMKKWISSKANQRAAENEAAVAEKLAEHEKNFMAVWVDGDFMYADVRKTDGEIAAGFGRPLEKVQSAISQAREIKQQMDADITKSASAEKLAADTLHEASARKQAIESGKEVLLSSRVGEVTVDDDDESQMLATIEMWALPNGTTQERQILHY